MTITFAFAAGEAIEARDPNSHKWRKGFIRELAPYRGRRPGYYVGWTEGMDRPKDDPGYMPSEGGWHPEQCIRKPGERA